MKKIYPVILITIVLINCKKDEDLNSSMKVLFTKPIEVNVIGYYGNLMEPFISRDGGTLFFNNLNDPDSTTNLLYASKVNDSTFNYLGEIKGINSNKLDAVASCDSSKCLYFISLRNSNNYTNIYKSNFLTQTNFIIEPVQLIKDGIHDWVNFDTEISYDGKYILVSQGVYNTEFKLIDSEIIMAEKINNSFVAVDQSFFKNINSEENLEYAACISKDMLEIYFTRAIHSLPHIFVSTRKSTNEVFGEAHIIESIEGFSEAPALSPDGKTLYYHTLNNGKFSIFLVRKRAIS